MEDEVIGMNITMQRLLQKMEREIQSAKTANSETKIRERIHAIKTLCELVLEEPEVPQHQAQAAPKPQTQIQLSSTPQLIHTSTPISIAKNEPLNIDDGEANGDSLFDF